MPILRITPLARPLYTRSFTSTFPRLFPDPYPLPLDPSLATPRQATDAPSTGIDWPLPQALDRTGEDEMTLRARLVYQTRKRGTLESDLLLSTFARDHLRGMTVDEMREFDKLLDEPDWDIYYWSIYKRDPPPRWKDTALLAKLQQHAKNEGKAVRMMPALMQRDPKKQ